MSNKRGIGLTVLVCIITSVLTSLLTIVVMKNNIGDTNQNSVSKKIVVNDSGKSQNIYHAVSDKAMPSVVGITTTTISNNNIFAIPTQSEGVGTGVIVDSKGYILTNSHVVSDGQAVDVKVLFNDGSTTQGKVLWNDAKLDLAMVKVDKTGLTAAELGDSDQVRVGDIAIAIGNPLGLEFQKSVTQGIISGLDRTISTEETTMTGLIQTDASINAGNSGGPLLNSSGEVIGINTAKASEGEGLGFSIPINTAKPIIESIIKNGSYEKVTLGIKGTDASTYAKYSNQQLSSEDGVYVSEVVSGSAAEKAGVKSGDIITKIDDTDLSVMSDLTKHLYNYTTGDSATLVVNRNGKEVKLNVKF